MQTGTNEITPLKERPKVDRMKPESAGYLGDCSLGGAGEEGEDAETCPHAGR